MAEKMGHTEPFLSKQNSVEKDKGEKVPIKSRMSKVRNAGVPDPLTQALKGRNSYTPTEHTWTHSKTPKPTGAHYNPAGEYGRPKK